MIHQLERGRKIGGFGGRAVLRFHLRKELCDAIVPADFPREFVPDVDLRAIKACAPRIAPRENFLFAPADAHPLDEISVGHAEHSAEHSIQADTQSEIRTIFLRQFFSQMTADFVEHPADVIEPADALARAAEGRIDHANNSRTKPRFSNASRLLGGARIVIFGFGEIRRVFAAFVTCRFCDF